MQQLVDDEVAKGHMLGPFDTPPLPNLVYSPINFVPKSNGKNRLIHDLSHPWDGVNAVNDCIPLVNSQVRYHHIDDVIDLALAMGTTTNGARCDISHAFRNLPVCALDLPYLAFTLNGKIYLNSSVPFGAASSCLIFERVATLLEWIVRNETGRETMSHYLDDYVLLGFSYQDTLNFVHQFEEIMAKIHMPVAQEKTIGPTPRLEYLGLLTDFARQVLTIPEKKRVKCLDLIHQFIQAFRSRKKSVKVHDIQELAGHLNFICQALPAGHTFMTSLYSLIAGSGGGRPNPGHFRRINQEIHDDLVMFQDFLDEMGPESARSIPFLIRRRRTDSDVRLFADAAGASHLALGCVFEDQWAQGMWRDTDLFTPDFRPNIAVLELLAIVMAFEIWAPQVTATSLVLKSDNQATGCWINSRRSDIPAAMNLIRHLTKQCLLFQIFVTAEYLPSKVNRLADLVSRNRMAEFFQENPWMRPQPEPLPTTLWPPRWSREQLLPRNCRR